MATFWLPYDYDEELKVLQELRELDFLDYDQKARAAKMISHLKHYGVLDEDDKEFVGSLLNEYGVFL